MGSTSMLGNKPKDLTVTTSQEIQGSALDVENGDYTADFSQ